MEAATEGIIVENRDFCDRWGVAASVFPVVAATLMSWIYGRPWKVIGYLKELLFTDVDACIHWLKMFSVPLTAPLVLFLLALFASQRAKLMVHAVFFLIVLFLGGIALENLFLPWSTIYGFATQMGCLLAFASVGVYYVLSWKLIPYLAAFLDNLSSMFSLRRHQARFLVGSSLTVHVGGLTCLWVDLSMAPVLSQLKRGDWRVWFVEINNRLSETVLLYSATVYIARGVSECMAGGKEQPVPLGGALARRAYMSLGTIGLASIPTAPLLALRSYLRDPLATDMYYGWGVAKMNETGKGLLGWAGYLFLEAALDAFHLLNMLVLSYNAVHGTGYFRSIWGTCTLIRSSPRRRLIAASIALALALSLMSIVLYSALIYFVELSPSLLGDRHIDLLFIAREQYRIALTLRLMGRALGHDRSNLDAYAHAYAYSECKHAFVKFVPDLAVLLVRWAAIFWMALALVSIAFREEAPRAFRERFPEADKSLCEQESCRQAPS